MMQKRILLVCFLMGSAPIVSFAAFRPVVTLSSGFVSANVYSSKLVDFDPFQNAYIGTKHYDTETDAGLLIGAETIFLQNWGWQIGLSYFENDAFKENGNVYQFADPAFNNLTYQYQIQSRRVSLETKISHAFRQVWHPYFLASVGNDPAGLLVCKDGTVETRSGLATDYCGSGPTGPVPANNGYFSVFLSHQPDTTDSHFSCAYSTQYYASHVEFIKTG
jgi:hypothetical protein